jgi:hypothetical protein
MLPARPSKSSERSPILVAPRTYWGPNSRADFAAVGRWTRGVGEEVLVSSTYFQLVDRVPHGVASVSPIDEQSAPTGVSSRPGEPTPERGGRAKRLFRLEPEGVAALGHARGAFMALWEGFELGALDR